MKFNPIALFTSLTVAAAGAAGYVALNPTLMSPAQPVPVVSAPAAVAEVPATKPAEVKPAEQVAIVVQPAPVPAPVAPSFDTVRVETGGEAVIAGRAEPDTEVVAKLNGLVIATTKTSPDGSFVLIPAQPLPAGAGTLSLETTNAGLTIASAETVAVAVKPKGEGEATIAVLTPDEPTKIVQAPASPSNSVVLDAVDYNVAGDIVFSGRAQPGAAIRLYVDNAIAGETKADDGGKWNYAGQSEVPAGQHMLRADAIASDGAVTSRVELPFLREAAAKVAAATPPAAVEPAPVAAPAAVAEVPAVPAAPAVVAEAPAAPAAEAVPVPEVTVPAQVVEATPQPTRIVIQPGNNLWTLSRELYGFGKNYTVIYEANKDQIRNPRLIFPGQILTAPVAQSTTP